MKDLTICIPTFNRLKFLEWTMERTLRDFPGAAIVVSDNQSTDGTRKAEWPGVRMVRQQSNIGAFPNMRKALLMAQTKYCVFLADDDYLLPEQVAKGMEYLDTNPDVVAYFAPCRLYDEVKGKADWDAFYPADNEKFLRADLLWDFIINHHVWPEHAIYRREGLDSIMQKRAYAYWCFVDLANAVRQGPVYFAKEPYYHNITQHPMGGRVKLGDQQCLTDFDLYRAGLEVLAWDLFGNYFVKTPGLQRKIQRGIDVFIWTRIEVAHRLRMMQGKTAEADEFYKRLMVSRPTAG